MKVTKEEVENARAVWLAADAEADTAEAALTDARFAAKDADALADKAQDKYLELKEEFDNESN